MDQATALRLQASLDSEVTEMKNVQSKINELIPVRQKILTQLNENNMVKTELDLLSSSDDGNSVYKLIGPVLIKQDLDEAKQNVENRIKYFKGEIERMDKQEKEYMQQRTTQQSKIQKIQENARQLYQQAVSKATQQQQQSATQQQSVES
jgi:prefoldin beta subunit